MSTNGSVIGIVGSPNHDGRTNELISAALDGAASTGGVVEKIQLADHVADACKDCLPWVCKDNLKCTYPDEAFEFLSQKLLDCGALILGTPVPPAIPMPNAGMPLSGAVRAYTLNILRMRYFIIPLVSHQYTGVPRIKAPQSSSFWLKNSNASSG